MANKYTHMHVYTHTCTHTHTHTLTHTHTQTHIHTQPTTTCGNIRASRITNHLGTAIAMHFSSISLREPLPGGSCWVNGWKENSSRRVLVQLNIYYMDNMNHHRSRHATIVFTYWTQTLIFSTSSSDFKLNMLRWFFMIPSISSFRSFKSVSNCSYTWDITHA